MNYENIKIEKKRYKIEDSDISQDEVIRVGKQISQDIENRMLKQIEMMLIPNPFFVKRKDGKVEWRR